VVTVVTKVPSEATKAHIHVSFTMPVTGVEFRTTEAEVPVVADAPPSGAPEQVP
jgi:hypothetical protein